MLTFRILQSEQINSEYFSAKNLIALQVLYSPKQQVEERMHLGYVFSLIDLFADIFSEIGVDESLKQISTLPRFYLSSWGEQNRLE